MPYKRRKLRTALSLLGTSLLTFSGCTERAAEDTRTENIAAERKQAEPPAPGARNPTTPSKSSGEGSRSLRADELDTSNRFLSAVMVTAHASMMEGGEVDCSGVLIGPRLVLTSGSCACGRPKIGEDVERRVPPIDGTACTAEVTVTTIAYEPPATAEELGFVNREYKGRIRPHPEFKLQPGNSRGIQPGNADLAVILLEKPIKNVEPVKLANSEVEAGESVAVVGFARDASGGSYRKRHYTQGRIAKQSAAGNERFTLEPSPLQPREKSDAGGPILRESAEGPVLVGILNGTSGDAGGAFFTSTSFYRTWLLDELQRAAGAGESPRRNVP